MYNHTIQHQKPSMSFSGIYRGIVEDNLDPKEAGRCRIRIIGVYDDLKTDNIPWAHYADVFMGGQTGFGGFMVPDIDSSVFVFFENEDHMQPVYFAGAPAHNHLPPERSTSEYPDKRGEVQYPHNRVWRTKAGHVLEFDDTPGEERIRIAHRTGTQIVMFANGDVHEQINGNLVRNVTGNIEENVDGNVTRSVFGSILEQSGNGSDYLSAGNIDVNGTNIHLN